MIVVIDDNGTEKTIENVALIRRSAEGEVWLCADKSGSSISVIEVLDVNSILRVES
jgi:hypothetical protein